MKTFEELIEEFVTNATNSKKPFDYSNKKEVKEHNKFVINYREIAKKINDNYQTRIDDFVKLLRQDTIKTCCAVCIIEIINCEDKYKQMAIRAIEDFVATSDDKASVEGFKIYLKGINK